MTRQRGTFNDGWSGFERVKGDGTAANTATVDLINILNTVEIPIVVIRRDVTISGFNKAASDVLGLSQSDIGRASRDISVFADLPRLEQLCSQAMTDRVESRTDFRDGYKWFVVRISPYTKSDGQVIGTVLTFTNVTAFRASVDQAVYERECTKAIINTVADPLVVLSADQRIQSGNRAFYALFGVSRDDTQGVPLRELGNGGFDLALLRKQFEEMLAGSHAFQPIEVDHVFTTKGQRTLILDAHPLSFPGHSEHRVLVTFQDITARKQAQEAKDLRSEEELRRSETFLAESQRLSLTGSFSWKVATGEITWSEELYRIYEFEIGVPVTLELIRTRVHPEDLTLLEKMVEHARSGENDFEWPYRLVMPDHSIKYLHAVAHASRNQDGQLEYIAAIQDVTARRLSEEARDNARVDERSRVARELHDTLLQTLHGLLFEFQAVRNLLPGRPNEAVTSLDAAINETEKALAESRDAIQGLRSEPLAKGNLAELLMATSRDLATSEISKHEPPAFELIEEGERRTLSPATTNEVCRIALEILRNAYRHARAHRIEAEIRYEDNMIRLRIRDDGKGITAKVLKEGASAGHWGLRGIRERAERIGAQLEFWSEAGAGTEVQLTVPAPVAYETSGERVGSSLLRKVRKRA